MTLKFFICRPLLCINIPGATYKGGKKLYKYFPTIYLPFLWFNRTQYHAGSLSAMDCQKVEIRIRTKA